MITSIVSRKNWQKELNNITKTLENRKVNIEVVGMEIGDQFEAKDVSLRGVTYDPNDNMVQILSDNFTHVINEPASIFVTRKHKDIESLDSIEIVGKDDRRDILKFIITDD